MATGLLGIYQALSENKRRRARTNEDIRRERAGIQSKSDIDRENELRRERDLAKNVLLREVALGGDNPQRRAEDLMLDIKTSGPRSTSAMNVFNEALARENLLGVPGQGLAQRTGSLRDTAAAEFDINRIRGEDPKLASDAANEVRKMQAITSALGGAIAGRRMTTAPMRAEAEDVADTAMSRLAGERAEATRPLVPQETSAMASGFGPTVEENANRLLRAQAVTPAAISRQAEASEQEVEQALRLMQILKARPDLMRELNLPTGADVGFGARTPAALSDITSAIGGMNFNPNAVLPQPTPGGAALPTEIRPRRRLGEPPIMNR